MKKVIKNMFMIFMILSIIIVSNNVYGVNSNKLGQYNEGLLKDVTKDEQTLVGKFGGKIGNVYATLFVILRVLGVAGIVIQGVRYMYAGADAKGKIKQSLIYIIIGTIFIFGAGLVVDSIVNSANEIIPKK